MGKFVIAPQPSCRRHHVRRSQPLRHRRRSRDTARLAAIPAHFFRSGTSETKNWIAGIDALAETNLQMNLIDYVPCYRSKAGTGNAMAFATWQ